MFKLRTLILLIGSIALVGCGSEETASSAAKSAADAASDAAESAAGMASDAAEAAADTADSAMAAASETADAAMDAASGAMDSMKDAAKDAADDASAAMSGAAAGAMAAATDAVDSAKDAMKTVAGGAAASGDCALSVEVGDTLAYNVKALSVPKSCGTATVTLTHTGKMPKTTMGHNWVLVANSDVQTVANASLKAGADNNYVPSDERVIAATTLVGGGESATVEVSLADLDGAYTFMCTFPGHWAVMKGTFTVGS